MISFQNSYSYVPLFILTFRHLFIDSLFLFQRRQNVTRNCFFQSMLLIFDLPLTELSLTLLDFGNYSCLNMYVHVYLSCLHTLSVCMCVCVCVCVCVCMCVCVCVYVYVCVFAQIYRVYMVYLP